VPSCGVGAVMPGNRAGKAAGRRNQEAESRSRAPELRFMLYHRRGGRALRVLPPGSLRQERSASTGLIGPELLVFVCQALSQAISLQRRAPHRCEPRAAGSPACRRPLSRGALRAPRSPPQLKFLSVFPSFGGNLTFHPPSFTFSVPPWIAQGVTKSAYPPCASTLVPCVLARQGTPRLPPEATATVREGGTPRVPRLVAPFPSARASSPLHSQSDQHMLLH